jgi:hypothetical protein
MEQKKIFKIKIQESISKPDGLKLNMKGPTE